MQLASYNRGVLTVQTRLHLRVRKFCDPELTLITLIFSDRRGVGVPYLTVRIAHCARMEQRRTAVTLARGSRISPSATHCYCIYLRWVSRFEAPSSARLLGRYCLYICLNISHYT